MNYQRGAASNGWMGNGAWGVGGTSASASLTSGTGIDAPEINYTTANGQQRTSTVKHNTQDAYLTQSELRLQTNVAVTSDQTPLSAVFLLRKTTEPNDGGTPVTTESLALLQLSITSGMTSNTHQVLHGTLPADVTVTGGVVSLRPPTAVEGKYIWYDLLPIEIDSRDRAVTGKIPHLGSLMGGNKKFEIGFQAGGTLLGKYEIPQSGSPQGVKIYDNAESDETGIFGDSELNQADSPPSEIKNQQVVLTREGSDIRFYTVADNISTFKVLLYLDGSLIGTVDHQLKADSEFEKFIAAIEGFVAGDDPRKTGGLPDPVFAAAPQAPNPTSDQQNQMLNMLPPDLASAYPGNQTSGATQNGNVAIDPDAFRFWIRAVKEQLQESEWLVFSSFVSGLGYDVNAANGPIINGWFGASEPDAEVELPAAIRNRGLVAKVLVYWMKKSMKVGVSTGKGMVYGLWDGVKSDWEDVTGVLKMPQMMYDAISDPFTAAAEIYNLFKTVKDMTWQDMKTVGTQMFNEFMGEQNKRLEWPDPQGAPEALVFYMHGYLNGYIGEQVGMAVLLGMATGGANLTLKGGKIIATVVKTIKVSGRILGSIQDIKAKLPKMLTNRLARLIEDTDDLRVIRSGASQIRQLAYGRFTNAPDITRCIDTTSAPHWRFRELKERFRLNGSQPVNIEAHHLIPWQWRGHDFVKKAARGGFDINDPNHNGTLMNNTWHRVDGVRTNHTNYNTSVKELLDDLNSEWPDISDEAAADLLMNAADTLRTIIKSRPHPLTMAPSIPRMEEMPRLVHLPTQTSSHYVLVQDYALAA
jgi:hypothetical protein